MESYIIYKAVGEEPQILKIVRGFDYNKQELIDNAREIAAQYIKADAVEGVNYYIGKDYLGGMYCDDLSISKCPFNFDMVVGVHADQTDRVAAYGTIVWINELEPTSETVAQMWLEDIKKRLEGKDRPVGIIWEGTNGR